jgi:hypothetical protein
MSVADLVALGSNQWSAMASDDLVALTTSQWSSLLTFPSMTADDLVALTTHQWSALATDDLRAIVVGANANSIWNQMATDDLDALTTAQWAAIETAAIGSEYLSAGQLAALSTEDWAAYYNSPLVLDLDGNGLDLLSLAAGVRFDLQAIGEPQRVGWVAPSDGLLARDLDGDGLISSGAELFGDATALANGSVARDGFVALSDLDDNRDGRIDQADSGFDELFVWRDLDSDGFTDPGELQSLVDSGVTMLELAPQTVSWWQAGNEVRLESGYQNQAGQDRALVDVWFAVIPPEDILDPTSALTVPSLIAPMVDESGNTFLQGPKP